MDYFTYLFRGSVMRKSNVLALIAVAVIGVSFSGCATLSEFGDKIAGVFNGDSKSRGSRNDDRVPIKPVASALKTAESYEKAYSYRTDTPNKTVQTFMRTKNVDTLRGTNPDEYVKTIVAKINETATSDFERVKLAHDAICLLVSYDAKNFWANTVPDQSWQTVVKTKTAVCEGYANLFQRFCSELRLSSQKVTGYARGVGTSIADENPRDSNHAWNIVKIEDCWYLVDCTWDSGYMSGGNSVQSYTTDWLFLRPEQFACSHLPTDSRYQLIQPPLSLEKFSALPDFRPKLFELAGDSLASIKKQNYADDSFEFEFRVKDGYRLSFNVSGADGRQVDNRTLTEKNGDVFATRMNFPEAGTYTVNVFYSKDGAKTGRSCGQFLVTATKGNNVTYPAMFQVSAQNVKIITPKQSPLKAGETVRFEIHAEGRAFAAVIVGKNFNQLENDGNGNFVGDVDIPPGTKKVSVGLSSKLTGSYETLAVYEVK